MRWLDQFLSREVPAGAGVPTVGSRDEVLDVLCAGLPPQDAQDLREERAGILEYEAGFTRAVAERMAGLSQQTERKAS